MAHLRIFAERAFPLDVKILLALVDVEEDRVGGAAVKALQNVTDAAVRALAFRLIESRSKRRGEAIDLIAANFEPGDHRTVLRWFEREEETEMRHSLGLDLKNFWKRHPEGTTEAETYRALYEKGPCSFCRETAVRGLLRLGALPDDLRAECAFDSNDEIRELISG